MSNIQQTHLFECQITRRLPYLLALPEGYHTQERWPLVLFLHGAGERGNDLEKLKSSALPHLIESGQQFPFITVSPQCPEDSWWSFETQTLIAFLDSLAENYAIDPDRIYLTGLSMGAMGTWTLSTASPQRFAALLPICGRGDPGKAALIKHIPAWVFHGAKDTIVPLKGSEEMVEALEACGGKVKFTVYPEANHDSWTETYNNPEIYTWLLAQKRVSSVQE